jgi:hypothetical protein
VATDPKSPFTPISPDPQLIFHGLLVAARRTVLADALIEAVTTVDPVALKRELGEIVPIDVQRLLAGAGIRDEQVFPTPIVLAAQPTLVGYYRLLLGSSKKAFYTARTGLSPLSSMGERGTLTPAQVALLAPFCDVMAQSLADLVRRMTPAITARDVVELPLLTLGSQFQGGRNNVIGQLATQNVFLAIAKLVEPYIVARTATTIEIVTPSSRRFRIALASDPDLGIDELSPNREAKRLSIEIKGGSDRSNVYNRGGEAEKSHQSAKQRGYGRCWTIIELSGVDVGKLYNGSKSTDEWFDAPQIMGMQGSDWDQFVIRIKGELGLP